MKVNAKIARLSAAALLLCGCCLLTLSDKSLPALGYIADVPKNGVCDITDRKIIRESMTVGEDDTLYVRDGGELYVLEGVTLTLKGKLKCENGGSIYVKGVIYSKEGSDISNNGKIKLLSTGALKLGGKLSVRADGEVKGNGTLSVLNDFSDISCEGTVTAGIKAPEPEEIDGVTFVGGVLLVNKKYELPRDYGEGLDLDAYSAYVDMKKASGYDMEIVSGFRSYERQEEVYKYWCGISGIEKAKTYSAQPGHSEHQAGLAIDITSLEQTYADTDEGKWLAENCWKYGFIIRYPKDKMSITGYMWEPWHVRYLGKSTAKLVHDSGLTLEEFLCL